MGVSENGGTLFAGPFKRILFYLGSRRGTPHCRKPPYAPQQMIHTVPCLLSALNDLGVAVAR